VSNQPAISFSISFQHHFNRAGGRTSNVARKARTMEIQKEVNKPTPLFVWTMRLAGSFIAFIVIFLYTKGIQAQSWPPGHPWSGITESFLAISLFASSFSGRRSKVTGFCFALIATTSAILWAASAR
jgi:hypothetical protein